jgi:hypothetical protein
LILEKKEFLEKRYFGHDAIYLTWCIAQELEIALLLSDTHQAR